MNDMKRVAFTAALVLCTATLALAQEKTGKDLYLDSCAVCHGADGAGQTAKGKKLKAVNVRDTVKKFTAEQMVVVVAKGPEVVKGKEPAMEPYAKVFTADQILGIVEYYRSLAK